MSVVNKMLQDLEARQATTDHVSADYQPVQKKPSNGLVITLFIAAIVAIIIGATADLTWFEQDTHTPTLMQEVEQVQPQKNKMRSATTKKQDTPVIQKAAELAKNHTAPADMDTYLTEPLSSASVKENRQVLNDTAVITSKLHAPQTDVAPSPQTEGNKSNSKNRDTSHFVMQNTSVQNQTNSLKQRIAESISNNDLVLAKTLLLELLENEPDNLNARKKLASLLFAQGQYKQSQQLLLQGIEQRPAQADLRLMLARLYMAQNNSQQAMDILIDLQPDVQSDENVIEYLGYRAALAQQMNKNNLAQADYLTLTKIEPIVAKWWLGLAITQDQSGEISAALQAYDKAKALNQLDDSVGAFVHERIQLLTGVQ